jgi:hypothetical protein
MKYGELTETYMNSNVRDNKGREIGFIVGFRDNGTDFRAYVQNARRINGEWKDFGVRQRSLSFIDQPTATLWAYSTARERIAKLQSKVEPNPWKHYAALNPEFLGAQPARAGEDY